MRHFRSILYALVLAPAAWVLTGVGLTGELTGRGRDRFAAEAVTGLALLMLAGTAYGILVLAPISPAGPVAAGLVYLALALRAMLAPAAYAAAWPPSVVREGFDLARPGYGLAALLAVPLICTGLSARRWARYVPPVLPVIGTIGRFRGEASAPGTPIAIIQTMALNLPAGLAGSEDTTVASRSERNPTVVVPGPSGLVAASAAEALLEGSSPPAGSSLPAGADVEEAGPSAEEPGSTDEESTEQVSAPADAAEGSDVVAERTADEPTEEVEPPVDATSSSEDAAVTVGLADGEPAAVDGTAEGGDAAAAGGADGETTANLPGVDADNTEQTQVVRLPGADEAPSTQVVPPVGDSGEKTQVVRVPLGEAEGAAGAGPPGGDAAERARVVRLPEAGERTQVVRLPVADVGEQTQVVRLPLGDSGEKTQVLRVPVPDGAERTQVIKRPAPGPDEVTQVLKFPGQPSDDRPVGPGQRTRDLVNRVTGDVGGDETQVIRPGRSVTGERTQVIRPGLVSPPGERTQHLEPRRPARAGEQDAPEHAGAVGLSASDSGDDPVSIAGAERPDFGEDPTSPIVPPAAARDDEETVERSMTVMKMERPEDELAEDVIVHIEIPAQRRPAEDD